MGLSLLRDLVDFCYPGICTSCKGVCEAGVFLCDGCLKQLTVLEQSAACDACAMPLAYEEAPCPFCLGKGVPHYDRIVRLGTFDEPLKDLIHQLKYQGRWNVGEQLAGRLLLLPRIRNLLEGVDVVVPVPLHWFRRFGRGYNQAMVIAHCVAKAHDKPLARPLSRVRNTETQTHLHTRAKRVKNLRNAFKLIDAKSVSGKRVVIVDDVMTTGATLQTVARALRGAKPASLTALVLAVADPRGRGFRSV